MQRISYVYVIQFNKIYFDYVDMNNCIQNADIKISLHFVMQSSIKVVFSHTSLQTHNCSVRILIGILFSFWSRVCSMGVRCVVQSTVHFSLALGVHVSQMASNRFP